MYRDETKLEARRRYVKQRVAQAKSTTAEVKQIAKELFISEATIWKDLQS